LLTSPESFRVPTILAETKKTVNPRLGGIGRWQRNIVRIG